MNADNFKMVESIIKETQRFDVRYVCTRMTETGPDFSEAWAWRDLWTRPDFVGNITGWANACAEHDPLNDEDFAASWLGITIDQLDQITYLHAAQNGRPSLWTLLKDHYKLDWEYRGEFSRVNDSQIPPNKAADLLRRLRTGDVDFT